MFRCIRLICLAVLYLSTASAEEFSIQFASPVAAGNYQMKRSAFVFRTMGCSSDIKPEVSATAEGLVDGRRRSMPLKVAPGPSQNVFGIFQEWPASGIWVVSLRARCEDKSAGALVKTDAKGALVRDASTTLDHDATGAEIEAVLNAGKKTANRND